MPTTRSYTVKYFPKSWLLTVKSPTQSLDYCANSCHIHLNTLNFHGYGKEISQKCPCSLYPINTSFLGTFPSSCHFASSKPIFLVAASLKSPRTSSEDLPHCPLLPREEMAINFIVPEVNLVPSFFSLPYFPPFTLLFTKYFLSSSFFYSSSLQTFRNWPRKLLFLLSNHTFNASVHCVIRILPIWSMRKQIGSPLELRTSL